MLCSSLSSVFCSSSRFVSASDVTEYREHVRGRYHLDSGSSMGTSLRARNFLDVHRADLAEPYFRLQSRCCFSASAGPAAGPESHAAAAAAAASAAAAVNAANGSSAPEVHGFALHASRALPLGLGRLRLRLLDRSTPPTSSSFVAGVPLLRVVFRQWVPLPHFDSGAAFRPSPAALFATFAKFPASSHLEPTASNVRTTDPMSGLSTGLAAHMAEMTSASRLSHELGRGKRSFLPTTESMTSCFEMFAPVQGIRHSMSSHSTIPRLYTSTLSPRSTPPGASPFWGGSSISGPSTTWFPRVATAGETEQILFGPPRHLSYGRRATEITHLRSNASQVGTPRE